MIEARLDRVCIVMMSALGDAVHTLPVVTAVRRHHPNAHITWVLQPGPATLVRGHPAVDEIILFERKRGARAFLDIARELRGRRFDLVLDLQVYFKAGVITGLARAPVKLGFDRARARDLNWLFTTHRIPASPVQHVQDQYFEFLRGLGIPAEPVVWDIGPWPHERDWQRDFFSRIDRPVASLVIGTSNPEKDWIPERWAELSDALHERHGLEPVLVGGRSESEKRTGDVIAARARHTPRSTLGISVREMIGVLDGSALVVSLDTGPLHMAVALDRPTIALMGYHNPKRVGPYRRFRDLMIDAYGDPGEDYSASHEHRSGRMPRIQVSDVLEKVELWSRRYHAGATAPAAAGG